MSQIKRPLVKLEEELKLAKLKNLIQDLSYNVYLAESYIQITFNPDTHPTVKMQLFNHIRLNYEVNTIHFLHEEKVLYISYDFWNRYPDQSVG